MPAADDLKPPAAAPPPVPEIPADFVLQVAHLYPDLLNLYGDYGNILALRRRARLRGIAVQVTDIGIGGRLDPDAYDLFFMGGGQDSEQSALLTDLLTEKRDALVHAARADKVFLGICGGYQMMGRRFVTATGRQLGGLGILDVETHGEPDRIIGDIACTCPLLSIDQPASGSAGSAGGRENPGDAAWLFGFENHSGRTELGASAVPLAAVVRGGGNNGKDRTEGAVSRNVFGTYMHGSFLPKNPGMCDLLLNRALSVRLGTEISLPPLSDHYERICRRLEMERQGIG